jgi:hypothetical protein
MAESDLPKDAKGKLIYLYLHPDDDTSAVGEHVQKCLNAELARTGQPQAPIWVIGLADQRRARRAHRPSASARRKAIR